MLAKVCVCTTLFLLGSSASASQLIVNGNFETGDLTGWSVGDSAGLGDFSVTNLTLTPMTFNGTVGPQQGSFYAVGDDFGPQTEDLTQTFTIPF
jgi:hypothetical protein